MANKPCKDCIHKTACITANPDMVKKTYQCEHYLPTADVVEVVRCGTCKYCERVSDQFDNDWYFCKKTTDNAEVPADHYCGYGERRDE